ncbi:MAG: TIR domain-containing protein, partial [Pseudomonadota bacterium]
MTWADLHPIQTGDIDSSLPTESFCQKIRDECLRDTSITIVLVGAETWKLKHVDWEIASSIKDTRYNPCSGLIGLLLPTHSGHGKGLYDQ